MAHGVHPAIKEMEPTGIDSPTDRARPEPDGEQLRPTHDSVLMGRRAMRSPRPRQGLRFRPA